VTWPMSASFRTALWSKPTRCAMDCRASDPGTAMTNFSPKDPLHGVTLETIVKELVEIVGWEQLGQLVRIRCFQFEPSVSSSLKFLRRTPWARAAVERLYIAQVTRRG